MPSTELNTRGQLVVYLDDCRICRGPAKKKCGGCSLAFYCGKAHQKDDWARHKIECINFVVKKLDGSNCVVAAKEIEPGTTILSEYPTKFFYDTDLFGKNLVKVLTAGGAYPYPCLVCSSGTIRPKTVTCRCSKCGIPLCQPICEKNILHSKECQALQKMKVVETRPFEVLQDIWDDVAILRLLMEKEALNSKLKTSKWKIILELTSHERVKFCKATMDPRTSRLYKTAEIEDLFPLSLKYSKTNIDRVVSLYWVMKIFGSSMVDDSKQKVLHAIFPWISHSCVPNADFWMESASEYYKMIVKTTVRIQAGDKITVNFDEKLDMLPTVQRRRVLQESYYIQCKCDRCVDPTELSTFFSGVICTSSKCKRGVLVSSNPLDVKAKWKCILSSCSNTESYVNLTAILRKAENELPDCEGKSDLVCHKLQQFLTKYRGIILHSNHRLIQMAICRLGKVGTHFLGTGAKLLLIVVSDLPNALVYLKLKKNYVEELLAFYEKIHPGNNIYKGKLLFESAVVDTALAMFNLVHNGMPEYDDTVTIIKDIFDNLYRCKHILSMYTSNDASIWIEEAEQFSKLVQKVFKNELVKPSTGSGTKYLLADIKLVVKTVAEKWVHRAEKMDLLKEYTNPEVKVYRDSNILELLISDLK